MGKASTGYWLFRLVHFYKTRINIASRGLGLTYSRLMHKIKSEGLGLNRKMLAHLAIMDPKIWAMLAEPIPTLDGWFEEREKKIDQERKVS